LSRVLDESPTRVLHPPGPEPTASRQEARRLRAERDRKRNGLLVAVALCVVVPTALVLSLWSNLVQPFWFNEQWRAYYISNPTDWFQTLKGDGAPFPMGWYFLERASGALFGSTELALRLPTAVFLPIGCVLLMLLLRRWTSTTCAVVVALIGTLTGTLFGYGIQVSEYQVDAAAVVAVVLLHEIAGEVPERGGWSGRIYLAYGGIALACLFGTPAVFIAGPLLLLDAIRAVARRAIDAQVLAAVGAGVIILAHLFLFVMPQNALTKSNYWDPQFLPHHGFGGQVAFVWDGLTGFITGVFTSSPQSSLPGLLVGAGWTWVLTLAFSFFLVVGVVIAFGSGRGRAVLFALAGSIVLTLIASSMRYWPFGFVRTNYYLIPLLFFLAGIGADRSVRWARMRIGAIVSRRAPGGTRGAAQAMCAAAVCVLACAGLVLAVLYETGSYRQTRQSVGAAQYGADIDLAVASVRTQDTPRTALVVTGGVMSIPGWKYYQYEYAGRSTDVGRQIAIDHVSFVSEHGSSSITELVDRVDPTKVIVYIPFGTTGAELHRDLAAVLRGGEPCHQTGTRGFSVSGMLVTLACVPR
jgi:hypothetical protein